MLRLRVLTSDASESSVADSTCASTVALTAGAPADARANDWSH